MDAEISSEISSWMSGDKYKEINEENQNVEVAQSLQNITSMINVKYDPKSFVEDELLKEKMRYDTISINKQ